MNKQLNFCHSFLHDDETKKTVAKVGHFERGNCTSSSLEKRGDQKNMSNAITHVETDVMDRWPSSGGTASSDVITLKSSSLKLFSLHLSLFLSISLAPAGCSHNCCMAGIKFWTFLQSAGTSSPSFFFFGLLPVCHPAALKNGNPLGLVGRHFPSASLTTSRETAAHSSSSVEFFFFFFLSEKRWEAK